MFSQLNLFRNHMPDTLWRTGDEVRLGGICIRIVRTHRKGSMAIHIDHRGVRVLVPRRVSYREIEAFVNDRRDWIGTHHDEYTRRHPQRSEPAKILGDGSDVYYLGEKYRIRLDIGAPRGIHRSGNEIILADRRSLSADQVRNRLTRWYRSEAQHYLAIRTREFAAEYDLHPERITIRTYRSRWGCCSSRGEITYNWQLIMAPSASIDYVIVHELCHLRHPNHSRDFWNLVTTHMPDHRERSRWLDEHGRDLWI